MKLFEIFQPLFEMANIRYENTGLPIAIWIGRVGGPHSFRVKVSNHLKYQGDSFVMDISKDPKIVAGKSSISQDIINDVADWIILNYDLLMKLSVAYENGTEVNMMINNKEIMLPIDQALKYLQRV